MSNIDLINELKRANRTYYDDGVSELSDDQYDALSEAAERLGVGVSTLTPASPSSWTVVRHAMPMASISMVAPDVGTWKALFDAGKVARSGWASWKLDGLSLEVVYDENGKLAHCILRGDGMEGEDVLANAKHCRGIPHTITPTGNTVSIATELVITENNLCALNELREADGLPVYKSRRNAVALVRSRRASVHHLSLLTAVVIGVSGVHDPTEIKALVTRFAPVGVKRFIAIEHVHATPVTAWKLRDRTQTPSIRDSIEYQLDGIVYKGTDGQLIKLKFASSCSVTRVTHVVEQLGRTGVVSPVCKFEPVNLLGADVRRASVHNAELVSRDLPGLGVGAMILVSRRGDVIPHVERVITPSLNPWVPSDVCPSCSAPVIREGSIASCSADPGECSGTVVGLILKFCKELGIKWISRGVATALVENGVTVPAQLYTMDPTWLAEVMMPGGQRIGDTRAAQIKRELNSRSELTLGELLGSIGVPGCAKSIMESVAKAFPDPDQLAEVDEEELATIPGIGPVRAASIAAYLDTQYGDVIRPLLDVVSIKRQAGPLAGMSFCITLGLRSGSRPQAEARIRAAGGTMKSSVGRGLTYLVCNYPDEATSKLTRARELGVEIINEDQLLSMLGQKIEELQPGVDDAF